MSQFHSYSQTIFGRQGNIFEGVDQGFDPASEPTGRVQNSIDAEYTNAQVNKRKGYSKHSNYPFESVLSLRILDFADVSGLVLQLGTGRVIMMENI